MRACTLCTVAQTHKRTNAPHCTLHTAHCTLYTKTHGSPNHSTPTTIKQGRRGGRSGVRRCIRIDVLSSLPSVFPFSPQSSSRYSQEHKKTAPFFEKKRKLERKRKQKKRKNAKSQFWLRITRKVDATGPDFGCKFRLRRSPGASESVFGPRTVQFLTIVYVFSYFFCVAYLWRSLNTARFSDDSHFFVVTLSGGFCKNAFFHFFDEKCALRTYSVSMAFGDFRTQNYFFQLFFSDALWRLL